MSGIILDVVVSAILPAVNVDNKKLDESMKAATEQLALVRKTHCKQEITAKRHAAVDLQDMKYAADLEVLEALRVARAELMSR